MNQMSQVTLRKNKYIDNDSWSGKMMTRQTREARQKRELEKANLSLYLTIVHTQPSVSKVEKLRQLEKNRSRLSGVLSTRRSNADRVKSMADSLLKEKYGTTGSSNRLFQNCKNCAVDRINSETPPAMLHHSSSFDCGFGMPSPSQAAAI